MNKKGQIGTTATWIAATIIILAIMIIYIFGVGGVFVKSGKSSNSIGADLNKGNLANTNNLIFAVDKIKGEISLWADDDFSLSYEELINGKKDENAEKLCSGLEKYGDVIDFERNIIYFENGDEKLSVEKSGKGFECLINIPNSGAVAFDSDSRVYASVYFVTNENNKVKVMYLRK